MTDDPEEADGQLWPKKEWFFHCEFKDEEGAENLINFVEGGRTADEAFQKATVRLRGQKGTAHFILDMKPV